MIEFQARKQIRRILYSPLLLVILLVALLFFSRATYSLWQKYGDAKDMISLLEKEKSVLNAKQDNLAARVSTLKTDKGVEEAIREKFKVIKEGEGVVVIVDQKEKESDTLQSKTEIPTFLERVRNFFR